MGGLMRMRLSILMGKDRDFSKVYRKITRTGSNISFSFRNQEPYCLALACSCVIVVLLLGTFSLAFVLSNQGRESMHVHAGISSNDSRLVQLEHNVHSHGVVMSCPVGQTQNHRGNWKPNRMVRGVEAVIQQLHRFESSLPLFFGYYETEKVSAEPWCRNVSESYTGLVDVFCFKVPEQFPTNLYGYAKIYAIRHAPVDEALWLDCDVYPVRPLEPLFEDDNYQATGAMFWPDSRDFFDERKLESVLHTASSKELFPLSAWWVKQGFDSGIVLINRKECALEIEALCVITRTPGMKDLRSLSMGDKDIFHVVWMIHGRNFTLVPYIGESGNIQTSWIARSGRDNTGKRRYSPGSVGWKMSSQLKFGRDGKVYALHQLHRQPSSALVATLSVGAMFHRPKPLRYADYVKPFVLARKDLRVPGNESQASGKVADEDFVRNIERALITVEKDRKKVPSILEEAKRRRGKGLVIKRGPRWLNEAAAEMNKLWNPEPTPRNRYTKKFRGRISPRLQEAVSKGKFSKSIYNRLRDGLQEQTAHAA